MSFWENLWDIFWWFFTAFVFFAYLSRPRRRMADRSVERARRDQEEADSFIRRASDANPRRDCQSQGSSGRWNHQPGRVREAPEQGPGLRSSVVLPIRKAAVISPAEGP